MLLTIGLGSITYGTTKKGLLNENIERNEVEDIVSFYCIVEKEKQEEDLFRKTTKV